MASSSKRQKLGTEADEAEALAMLAPPFKEPEAPAAPMKLRDAARARAQQEIRGMGAISNQEKSAVYKRVYDEMKAEWEAQVAGILAGLPEAITAEAKRLNPEASTDECLALIPTTADNMAIVADVLERLGPALQKAGRRRSGSLTRRRHSMRGGALKEEITNFFAALCAFPRGVIGKISERGGDKVRIVRDWLANPENIEYITDLVLDMPVAAAAGTVVGDLASDNSVITALVTNILQAISDTLTPAVLLSAASNIGWNIAGMLGAAAWPVATAAALFLVKYGAREGWKKAYEAAERKIREEIAAGPQIPERVRIAKTWALAVRTYVANVFDKLRAFVNDKRVERLDKELEAYMAQARAARDARRPLVYTSPAVQALVAAVEAAGPAPGAPNYAALRAAAPLSEGPGGAGAGGEGQGGQGRRRTRKHRVVRRKTHKKRFHRK